MKVSHLLETSAYVSIKLYTPDPPGPWIQCYTSQRTDSHVCIIIGASLSEPHIYRRVECSQSLYYWGEPERAPHRRVECSQSIYYVLYGTYVSNLFHTRAAVYIVQQLAIYSGGRMKKLLRSPVPRAQSLLSQQNRLPL